MMLRTRGDHNAIVNSLVKAGTEVNGTYEHIGSSVSYAGTTEMFSQAFDISSAFEHDFIQSISTFEAKQIGPYKTNKYFLLIPSLKEALIQLRDDCVETRRCIITFPPEHCFQSMQFFIREKTVEVVCYMRSCDVIKNLTHDMWICLKMADIFAKYVSDIFHVHPYDYHKVTMMVGSLHVFKEDANVF